jgi:hypothetical protein
VFLKNPGMASGQRERWGSNGEAERGNSGKESRLPLAAVRKGPSSVRLSIPFPARMRLESAKIRLGKISRLEHEDMGMMRKFSME